MFQYVANRHSIFLIRRTIKTKISVRDGAWSSWSECSTVTGPGYGKFTRQCNNPAPDGGEDCPGPSSLDCLIVHRENPYNYNPYNYFEKTFSEYQAGFESNGMEDSLVINSF